MRDPWNEVAETLHVDGKFFIAFLVFTSTKFTDVGHDDHPSFLYCLMVLE